MVKINLDLMEKIKLKIFSDNKFASLIKLEVAKSFFICITFLYFLTYLFVLWWFKLDITAKILFFIYPLFAFSIIAFLYEICMYIFTIYTEKSELIKYILIPVFFIIYLFILATHLWIKIIS